MTVIDKMTKVLRGGSDASIRMMVKVYGRPCEIYHPNKTGIYSGHYDDIDYEDTPTKEMDLFIPNLFNKLSRTPALGQYDLLGMSDYYIIIPTEVIIPVYSKIVVTSPELGVARFVVRDNDLASTFEGSVFKRMDIEPLMDSSQDNDGLAGLRLATNHDDEVKDSIVETTGPNTKYGFYMPSGSDDYND